MQREPEPLIATLVMVEILIVGLACVLWSAAAESWAAATAVSCAGLGISIYAAEKLAHDVERAPTARGSVVTTLIAFAILAPGCAIAGLVGAL